MFDKITFYIFILLDELYKMNDSSILLLLTKVQTGLETHYAIGKACAQITEKINLSNNNWNLEKKMKEKENNKD